MSSLISTMFTENLKVMHTMATEKGWFADTQADSISAAFPQKRAVHAGMSGAPVPEAERAALLESLRSQERSGSSAAYVHLPYCESKCLYCGFFGGKYTPSIGAKYLKALLWEIEAETQYACAQKTPINALYLGGGTPTALQADELNLLLKTLRQCLPLANDCEITVEGRIDHFGQEKIEACLEAGANRFSLGVQSFNTEIRRKLGRIAAKEDVITHLKSLAQYNQAAIVIDLIYGLPGQSIEDWKEDIQTFLELPIDGVDLYQLNVFPGGSLHKAILAGKIAPSVPLNEQGNYFLAGQKLMQDARYNRLSISHWGRTTRERNMYNPLAKTRVDCLHFGSGSGGSLQGYFMANESNADTYIEQCRQGKKPVTFMAAPPKGLRAVQTILAHMEHCRLQLDVLTRVYQDDLGGRSDFHVAKFFAPLLENWEQAGLIKRNNAWMELTHSGQFWQTNITQALLGWHNLVLEEFNHGDTP